MMMSLSKIEKRFLLFLLLCIPSRLLLSFLTYISENSDILRILLGIILLIMSIGFISIYLFGLREKGLETMGEKIWWNNLRPLHGLFYGLSGLILLLKLSRSYNIYSSLLLLMDTIIGLISFTIFHYKDKIDLI